MIRFIAAVARPFACFAVGVSASARFAVLAPMASLTEALTFPFVLRNVRASRRASRQSKVWQSFLKSVIASGNMAYCDKTARHSDLRTFALSSDHPRITDTLSVMNFRSLPGIAVEP